MWAKEVAYSYTMEKGAIERKAIDYPLANRNFYHRKCVWYRNIAREYERNSNDIELALTEVQSFADYYFISGNGGWNAAEAALRPLVGDEAGGKPQAHTRMHTHASERAGREGELRWGAHAEKKRVEG